MDYLIWKMESEKKLGIMWNESRNAIFCMTAKKMWMIINGDDEDKNTMCIVIRSTRKCGWELGQCKTIDMVV